MVAVTFALRTPATALWLLGLALALVACSSAPSNSSASTSPPTSATPTLAPNPLGQPFHVVKAGPDGYDGLVNVLFGTEVHAVNQGDGSSHVFYAFQVKVSSTRGKLPTSDWSIETANPTAVVPQTHDMSVTDNSETPPLASNVSGNVAGYITFDVQSGTPVFLNLRDPSSSGALIAQWELGRLKD